MIHKYRFNDSNIVMDVNSGSIHLMDDCSFAVMDYFEENSTEQIIDKLKNFYNEDDIRECIAEISKLKSEGRLFVADVYEENFSEITRKNPVVKALCLHIAHDCNLKCKYCFAGEGEYHGDRGLMSSEVGKKALDFLIAHSGNRRNLEVDFFGGEPTLNFEVVKQIVDYGREQEKLHNKNFRFTLTTNALLLTDDIIDYANKNMHNVVLSLDGRKEVNDKMRPNRGGLGSYEEIVPNILRLVEQRGSKNYYVRGTFTSENLDFSEDVCHIADLGFKQVSVEPVVAPNDASYCITKEHLPVLFDEYDRLANIIKDRKGKENEFNFFHFNIDLSGGSCAAKRISGCGAGCEYLSVTPTGELFPCHQFTGMDGFKVGDVYSGISEDNVVEMFASVNVYTKPECKQCWAKFYCSGGCAANAYQFGGSIDANYEIGCELQKKRVECGIYLQSLEL